MFGKKKDKQRPGDEADKKSSVRIKTIPSIFYGGKDPLVYHAGTNEPSKQKKDKKKTTALQSPPGKISKPTSQSFFRKKSVLITGGIILFVIVVAAISWYYIRQSEQAIPRSSAETRVIDEAPRVEIPIVKTEEPELTEQPTTTEDIVPEPEDVPTTTPALEEQLLEFPSTILVDSVDLDEDSFTDREEELFGTDTGIPDTDDDGYQDGLEVTNLYNPGGVAPRQLIDSGLVREYINPIFQYRLYYPSGWEVGAVDPEARQVLLSSITGDFVEVRIVEKDQNQSFTGWFAEHASGQRFLDVVSFTNRFQEDGYKRKDSLVAFFVKDKIVYTLIYHPGTTGDIPYRHVMEMMIQSFRPDKTFVDIPDQPTLPSAPTTTETPFGVTTTDIQ